MCKYDKLTQHSKLFDPPSPFHIERLVCRPTGDAALAQRCAGVTNQPINSRMFALSGPYRFICCDVWQDASRMILTFCNTTPRHSRSFAHSRKLSPLVPCVSIPSLPLSLSRRSSTASSACVGPVGVTVCNSAAFCVLLPTSLCFRPSSGTHPRRREGTRRGVKRW